MPPGTAQEAARTERFEKQFFKTKVCTFWEKGRCTRGAGCKYAHGEVELQATPDLTNTALCREQSTTGTCTKKNCPFAHSWESLRATDKFYKTTMCSFFRYGRCRSGGLCRHAHSRDELLQAREKAKNMTIQEEGESEASFDFDNGRPFKEHPNHNNGTGSLAGDTTTTPVSAEEAELDSEDDFGPMAWERHVTTPAKFGDRYSTRSKVGQRIKTLRDYGKQEPNRIRNWADLQEMEQTSLSEDTPVQPIQMNAQRQMNTLPMNPMLNASPIQEQQDDDESDEDINDVDDMWARMQSMPARLEPEQQGPLCNPAIRGQAPVPFAPFKSAGPPMPVQFAPFAAAAPVGGPVGVAFGGGFAAAAVDDDDEELTLGPSGPMNCSAPQQPTDHWSRATSCPAPVACAMPLPAEAAGMAGKSRVAQPVMMMVPMMLMPTGILMPGGAPTLRPSGPVAVAAGVNAGTNAASSSCPVDRQPEGMSNRLQSLPPAAQPQGGEDDFSDFDGQDNGWARGMSAPAQMYNTPPFGAGGYPMQQPGFSKDLAKEWCARALGINTGQCELEAKLLKSAMPETYED